MGLQKCLKPLWPRRRRTHISHIQRKDELREILVLIKSTAVEREREIETDDSLQQITAVSLRVGPPYSQLVLS